jgi:hypothetical protein
MSRPVRQGVVLTPEVQRDIRKAIGNSDRHWRFRSLEETGMKSREPGRKLADIIKKAVADCEITNTEYGQIMSQAHGDLVIDADEKRLLEQLQHMIENGTVKRVRG